MTFVDILWTIVSGFLLIALAVAVGAFAVAVTWLEVTEGNAHENAQR